MSVKVAEKKDKQNDAKLNDFYGVPLTI